MKGIDYMEKIINYLLENIDELENVVREINSWNGSLEYLEAYPNDEDFFDTFFSHDVAEAVRAALYGDYDFNDDYVGFDSYGNLVSFSYSEYIDELKEEVEYITELLIEYHDNLYISDELVDLISENEVITCKK